MNSSSSDMVADSSQFFPEHKTGDRIECCGYLGTIQYIGAVEGHPGVWLGIDWDDPSRGKHNGTVNGVNYYQTRHPKSGSFVRREKVNFGQDIVKAIMTRYGNLSSIELSEQIKQQFQMNTNAPFIEVVGFDKVAEKQRSFDTLKIVDLQLQNINSVGEPLALQKLCPNIQELNIAKNLFTSWSDIYDICSQLPHLYWLNVSANVLSITKNCDQTFPNIKTLICSHMNLNWDDLQQILKVFTNIQDLRLPFNQIHQIIINDDSNLTNLQTLDLDGNKIESWSEIMKLSSLPHLENINLAETQINNIYLNETSFPCLKKINLRNNLIDNWESIGELNKLASLSDLKITGNPILETENEATRNQLIIARIGKLRNLNGSLIETNERRGAEYDYIKKYGLEWLQVKENVEEREKFLLKHNRYLELIEKYGNPEESELKQQSNKISSTLIKVVLNYNGKEVEKKIPQTLLIQKLIMLTQKLFKLNDRPTLLYKSNDHPDIQVTLDDEMKEIGYYSIQNGDIIFVYL